MFTESDLMSRVVAEGLNPKKVQVSEVMTSSIATVPLETPIREAANINDAKPHPAPSCA